MTDKYQILLTTTDIDDLEQAINDAQHYVYYYLLTNPRQVLEKADRQHLKDYSDRLDFLLHRLPGKE